jgi:sensor domain CHASE-containing protein
LSTAFFGEVAMDDATKYLLITIVLTLLMVVAVFVDLKNYSEMEEEDGSEEV